MEYDEETQSKSNNEPYEPGKKFCKVEADLTKHGDISWESWMTTYKQDSLYPAEQYDDSWHMFDGYLSRNNKHQQKGQNYQGKFHQVFNEMNRYGQFGIGSFALTATYLRPDMFGWFGTIVDEIMITKASSIT